MADHAVRRSVPNLGAIAGNISGYTSELINIWFHTELRTAACSDDMETFLMQSPEYPNRKIGYRKIIVENGIIQIKEYCVQNEIPRQFVKCSAAAFCAGIQLMKRSI